MARSMLCGFLLLELSQLAYGLFGRDAFLNHDISELQVMCACLQYRPSQLQVTNAARTA
jgi:hypothetical protein